MSTSSDQHKDVVRKFLLSVPLQDLDAIGECTTDDVLQHYQQPSSRADAGTTGTPDIGGREAILSEIRENLYQIYREGTIEVEIQRMVAEDDLVAAQFILRAVTAQRGEPYENWYHFLYRFEAGRIAEYWEYVDTAYAQRLLFPD
jgi:ketosteroid isomerase-like protein